MFQSKLPKFELIDNLRANININMQNIFNFWWKDTVLKVPGGNVNRKILGPLVTFMVFRHF